MNDIMSKMSREELISPDVVGLLARDILGDFIFQKETDIAKAEEAFKCLWEKTKNKAIKGKRYSLNTKVKNIIDIAESLGSNKYYFYFKKPANVTRCFFHYQKDFFVNGGFLTRVGKKSTKYKINKVSKWINLLVANDLEFFYKMELILQKIKKLQNFWLKKDLCIDDLEPDWKNLKINLGLNRAYRVEKAFFVLSLALKKKQ